MPFRHHPSPPSITDALGAATVARDARNAGRNKIADAEALRRIALEDPPVTAEARGAVIASLHAEGGRYVMMGTTGTRRYPVEGTDPEALLRLWRDFVGLQLRSLSDEPLN